jgi:uncharacterized protein (TIGR03083 family)
MVDVLAAVHRAAQRFGEVARTTPDDLPVPHLGPWTVRDVVAHLAADHEWAAEALRTGRSPERGIGHPRARGEKLRDRYDAATAELLSLLDDAASRPDEPCWNFARGDAGRRAWWPRHQAHEASVHLWDLQSATGVFDDADPALAADGISELAEVYTNRYGGQSLARPLVLRAPGHGAWRVAPGAGPGRVVMQPADDDGPADLEAPPDVLLLALWHRIPPDDARLGIAGDPGAVHAFLAGPLTA